VVIVGAGPIGSTVANIIAKDGYKVLILEEHLKVGLPTHCTGKISVNALMELNLPNIGVQHKVKGALFCSPDLNFLRVERKEVQAHIFDRSVLDQWLLNRAVDSGTTIIKNAKVRHTSIGSHRIIVYYRHKNETHAVSAKIIVGADGAVSSIARHFGLYSKPMSETRFAVQKEMTNLKNLQAEFVDIYLGKKFAPGFFAWLVPTGEESAKVGLGVIPTPSKTPIQYLEHFSRFHPIAKTKLEGGICIRQTVHILPIGGALNQTVSEGVLIVGDAAGQVKSTTGGGLYFGITCAKIAGNVISKALSTSDSLLQKDVLMEYQNLWEAQLGKEIKRSAKIRHILDSLTDDELNYLFYIIRRDKRLISIIESEGDLDWQSGLTVSLIPHLTRSLIKRPKLLLKLGKILVD